MVVATVAFCIGALLIGGAGIFLLLNLGEHRALRTLRRIVPSPIADRSGGRVALEGRTEYGPAGRQVGPVTGEGCAWFHVRLIREPRRGYTRGDEGPDHDLLLDFSSPAGFALADHSGRVPVDPALLSHPDLPGARVPVTTTLVHRHKKPVTLPPVVAPEFLNDLRRGEYLTLTETRVPRGVDVFALGRLDKGELKRSRPGLTVFTSDTRDKAIAARREGIAVSNRIIVGFSLVGLVLAGGGAGCLTTLA
jgi:hypothetical protein